MIPKLPINEMMEMVDAMSHKTSNQPDGIDYIWWNPEWLVNYVHTTDLSGMPHEKLQDLATILATRLEETFDKEQ